MYRCIRTLVRNVTTATIRHMRPADLVEVTSLTEKESWNLSQEVVRALFEYCPEGSFIAELQGKVVGAVMGFNLNEEESFGGMWVVSEQHRGQNIGSMLMQRIKEHFGDRNIGIFSVAESVETHKNFGFTVESWKICHVSGIIATEKIKLAEDSKVHICAFPSRHVQFDGLFQYDTNIHSVERKRFLRVWTRGKSTITLVAIGRTGEIVGYGVIKRDSNSTVLGPIYGETPSIMKTLLVNLTRKTTFDENINMWVPVESEILGELLAENKSTLTVLSEETRMFFHHEVKVPLEKIFAIASSEAGHC